MVACVNVASFASWRLYSFGISRSRWSSSFFSAPSFAKLSLSSFSLVPLWPFTHWKCVVAVLLFSRYAAFLKRVAFFIPVHPSSSQSLRFIVSPSVTVKIGVLWECAMSVVE